MFSYVRIVLGLIIVVVLSNCQKQNQLGIDMLAQSKNDETIKQDYTTERDQMIANQIETRGITDSLVLAAMRKVPRHEFIPESLRDQAYQDYPVPIGASQTISQPYIVAYMSSMLDLKPGEKLLEIGTGSGYQAAVLADMGALVFTIEIVETLALYADANLKRLGYNDIKVKWGDGYLGWEEYAPFDAIIVTCAPEEIPQPLIDQLANNGRIVIPVGPEFSIQEMVIVEKDNFGKLREQATIPVRFVPMTREIR